MGDDPIAKERLTRNKTMAANTYECMFLLDPNKVSGDIPAAAQQLHTVLERHHAEVLASRQWDERRLAYPIKGHKKGLYYLTYFRTEGKNLVEIERDFGLSELILRTLTLKVDPKLVDTMLALARDEHALALQSVPEAVGEDMGLENADLSMAPVRRGRPPVDDMED
jgi:small subunit ribosomal protein S6